MAISQIPVWVLIFHSYSELNIWQTSSWHIPPSNGYFTDSCSDCSYFLPTLRAQHLADQVLADLPSLKWQFHRFLLYPESSYLADHVVANLPPFIWQFHTFLLWLLIFLSYSKSSTCGRPGLGRSNPSQISISQILSLLWELVFGRPGLGISTPLSNGNLTDSCPTPGVHIWQMRSWKIYLHSKL